MLSALSLAVLVVIIWASRIYAHGLADYSGTQLHFLGIIGSRHSFWTGLITFQLLVVNGSFLVMLAVVVVKAVRTLKAQAHVEIQKNNLDHNTANSTAHVVDNTVSPSSTSKSIDLSDDAQLAQYIQQVRLDGNNLGMPKLASEFLGAETAMFGFLARTASEKVSAFVTEFVRDVNNDNSRADKLIFGHALTFRMVGKKAAFRHVPNAGVTKDTAFKLAEVFIQSGHFKTTVISEDAEREMIANVIYFLSALFTDLAFTLGFSFSAGRFDSEFKDGGKQSFDQLKPRLQLLKEGLIEDIDVKVVEQELEALPVSVKLAFAGRKEFLRLALLLAVDFTYGFYWFCEARMMGERMQPRLTLPPRQETPEPAGPISDGSSCNFLGLRVDLSGLFGSRQGA
eukprot:TRINITY_DN30900_c0_g2_i1.p1 TRINITY_DN30900_c0_g2~~TRINITY_DN30900_c0_g2_i1.p1  ORF type:complete len:460 (-),score=75.10 TRINITY_DN30900_c0_g2_i1:292-1482(-)